MGFLVYAGTQECEFEDRVLAHLKAAITLKLRRQESFLMSWTNPAEKGGGRLSIWLAPTIPLTFRFSGGRPPTLNQEWIDALVATAHTTRGLVVLSESEAESYLETLPGG